MKLLRLIRYPFVFFLMSLSSCTQHNKSQPKPIQADSEATAFSKPQAKDSFLIRITNDNLSHIYISYDLESDTLYNKLLGEYIVHYEYGYDSAWPATKLAPLVNRESFIKMALLFYGKGQLMARYPGIGYYDDRSRLENIGRSLVFSAYDCCHERFYAIADTLLTQDDFDGAKYLWDHADLQKLPSLNAYMSRVNPDNFMQLADLAAFFHNNHHYALRDSCLTRAGKVKDSHKQFLQLTGLIAKKNTFDYGTYSELLFNGSY